MTMTQRALRQSWTVNRLEREAKQLTRYLVSYVIKWADPDWASAHGDEYKERMAQLFLGPH